MPPLHLTYSEPAEAELAAAYSWLTTFGFEVAENWLNGLPEMLEHAARGGP